MNMNTEQKAKAYDEALEKGKQILNTPYTAHWDTMKEVVEHLLPEIKESDNERLRKELLNAFEDATDSLYMVLTPLKRKAFVDWLEKQGEKDEEILILKDRIESLSAANIAIKETHKIELEKKGEQKPAVIIPKFRVGDKIRRKTPRRYDKDMQVARIESNYYLCNHLGKFSSESISFSEESNYELVEWKPSVRQMDALKNVCVARKSTEEGACLCELYHDLEKLREE